MIYVALILLPLTLAACSSADPGQPENRPGDDDAPGDETTSGIEGPPETTTSETGSSGGPKVEQLTSGVSGQGEKNSSVLLADSAAQLADVLDTKVPGAGEGTYLAAFWGEKPTGGYSMNVESARVEGDRVTIRISLNEPPEGAMLTQALTYPYVAMVVKGVTPREKDIYLEDQNGRRLDWRIKELEF